MSFPEFSVAVRDHPGGATVKLRGHLDAVAVKQLDTVLRRVVAGGPTWSLSTYGSPSSLALLGWGPSCGPSRSSGARAATSCCATRTTPPVDCSTRPA